MSIFKNALLNDRADSNKILRAPNAMQSAQIISKIFLAPGYLAGLSYFKGK